MSPTLLILQNAVGWFPSFSHTTTAVTVLLWCLGGLGEERNSGKEVDRNVEGQRHGAHKIRVCSSEPYSSQFSTSGRCKAPISTMSTVFGQSWAEWSLLPCVTVKITILRLFHTPVVVNGCYITTYVQNYPECVNRSVWSVCYIIAGDILHFPPTRRHTERKQYRRDTTQ